MKKCNNHVGLGVCTCAAFVALLCLHPGCANTTAAPAGGPKDSIPPTLLATFPEVNATHVSTKLKQVALVFDEYVKLKDATKYVVLSPPPEKNPTVRTKGKGLAVDLLRDLDSNTTYCLYFGHSIQDNNEGNPFPSFALSFSTGDTVDSLMYSGVAVDASTLLPLDNATILLHINPTDTTLAKCRPVAATHTDNYGYFTLRNLKDTTYTLYAITDENNNFKYDPTSGEIVGFSDSLVRPNKVMFTYAPEIQPYFDKDTVGLLRRPLETSIYLFKEKSTRQVLRSYTRLQPRAVALKFGAPKAQIISFSIPGIDSTEMICQSNYYQDSLIYWLNADKVKDTLQLMITYMATDSLEQLTPRTDTLKLGPYIDPAKAKAQENNLDRSNQDKKAAPKAPKRETLSYEIIATPEVVSYEGITIKFNSLPIHTDFSAVTLTHTTPSKDTIKDTFTYQQDSLDLCTYKVYMGSYLEGTNYEFYIPSDAFTDVNRLPNDSTVTKFTTLKPDDLCAITLNLSNVQGPLIVDLMDEKRTLVKYTQYASHDTTLTFSYLKPGKFALRFTDDTNGNRLWDTGSVKEKRQAEKVCIFTLPGGQHEIELKEKMELSQSIDITQLFNQNVTLSVPPKK